MVFATVEPENVMVVDSPLQISIGPPGLTVTVGVGCIVIVNVLGVP